MMSPETVEQLLAINKAFYSQFADSFDQSRRRPQPGFKRLIELLPSTVDTVLDVGCGNGRFGSFIQENGLQDMSYTGIDFTGAFLNMAIERHPGTYLERNIAATGFLDGLEFFDLVVCLATMQHIPSFKARQAMLIEMRRHLAPEGRLFLSNWQFLDSERQRRKIREWTEAGLERDQVEDADYLLDWRRDGQGMRYVSQIDERETARLAAGARLKLVDQYRSDGKEGNLTLYSIYERL